jgi:hypothetical protein
VQSGFGNRFERETSENCGPDDKPSFVARMLELTAKELSKKLRDGQSKKICRERIAEVIRRERPQTTIDKGQEWVKFWNGTSDRANKVITGVKCDATGYKSPQYNKTWKAVYDLADAGRADVGMPTVCR